MKYIALTFFIYFITSAKNSCTSQNNVSVLNGYKYIYLAPLKYENAAEDYYGIRRIIKEKLQSKGFEIIDSDVPRKDIDNCLVSSCFVSHSFNFYKPLPDIVTLKFYNCSNTEIYVLEGETPTSMNNYTPYKGLSMAADNAFMKLNYYNHTFDYEKSFRRLWEKSLPTLEVINISEDSVIRYLDTHRCDKIEGIYKSINSEFMNYYKIAIVRNNDNYKAFILESKETHWKKGELKAIIERSSSNNIFSVRWHLNNKSPIETYCTLENNSILTLDFSQMNKNENSVSRFIKTYPNTQTANSKEIGDNLASGSGFFITTDGLIATNYHVVEDAKRIEVIIKSEEKRAKLNAEILMSDKINDIAILKIVDKNFVPFKSIPFGFSEYSEIGAGVFTIGFPLNDVMGENYKVSSGIISAKSGIEDDLRFYQISTPLQPGNSGGPLFDITGNIIGITTAKLNGRAVGTAIENVNYAIKVPYLISIGKMIRPNNSFKKLDIFKGLELQQQVKILKNYVCLIKTY